MSSSLYSVLPETAETHLAKEHSEMLSEVQNSIVMPTQQPNTVDSASSHVLHFTHQQLHLLIRQKHLNIVFLCAY